MCGLWGLGVVFLRGQWRGKTVWDEREQLIWQRSLFAAHITWWGVFVIACMTPWAVLGSKATIPVDVLPNYVFAGMVWIVVVQSLAILGQYGWRSHAGE